MLRSVVSVFDRAAQLYGQPVFVQAPGVAVRSFGDEVNRPGVENQMHQHPDDFDLFLLGQFDDESGLFLVDDGPSILARGKDLAVRS